MIHSPSCTHTHTHTHTHRLQGYSHPLTPVFGCKYTAREQGVLSLSPGQLPHKFSLSLLSQASSLPSSCAQTPVSWKGELGRLSVLSTPSQDHGGLGCLLTGHAGEMAANRHQPGEMAAIRQPAPSEGHPLAGQSHVDLGEHDLQERHQPVPSEGPSHSHSTPAHSQLRLDLREREGDHVMPSKSHSSDTSSLASESDSSLCSDCATPGHDPRCVSTTVWSGSEPMMSYWEFPLVMGNSPFMSWWEFPLVMGNSPKCHGGNSP